MRLLLIENSKTIASMLINELQHSLDTKVDLAANKAQAIELIEKNGPSAYKFVISCLNLPDAPGAEIIKDIAPYNIPTIIFTAHFDFKLRERLVSAPFVVDYVVKESGTSLRYLCNIARRLFINETIKVLVADDSKSIRKYVATQLRLYRFQVLEAGDGQEALDILEENRDIKMAVLDYNMPKLDGFDVTKKIRETYDKEQLAIIGLSGQDEPVLSARFIKVGANDFIKKPFEPEELFCRVSQNMDLIEKTKALLDAATKDFLTGLYNRRFFFEKGQGKLNRARRQKKTLALAMLDIDHFKSVNDTFGHDVGDEVLKVVSSIIAENVRPADLLARLGGEEFCVLLDDISKEEIASLFEKIRSAIEGHTFESLKERRYVTSSFGVIMAREDELLDEMVKRSDELLYLSKQSGRNKVTFEE